LYLFFALQRFFIMLEAYTTSWQTNEKIILSGTSLVVKKVNFLTLQAQTGQAKARPSPFCPAVFFRHLQA